MNAESTVPIVAFRYHARLGHFLRAESSASALTYPVPPRTALLGLCGAVLGLEKDESQQLLDGARFALLGPVPRTHWHRAKLRKTDPEFIPQTIARTQKAPGEGRPEQATLIRQELLMEPDYTVLAALPDPFHKEFEARLAAGRWHFTPVMGLSAFIARLEWRGAGSAEALPEGDYDCWGVAAKPRVAVDTARIFRDGLAVHLGTERLPRDVTSERVFTHEEYYLERAGRPLPVQTAHAWRARWGGEERIIIWL